MLPIDSGYEVIGADAEVMPNRTYRLEMDKKRIRGYINEDIEAVKQAVYLALRTERYDYIVFSRNYGVELKELFGREKNFVIPMLAGNITDALLADERITEVKDFNFDIQKQGVYSVSFRVVSIYGDFEEEVEIIV